MPTVGGALTFRAMAVDEVTPPRLSVAFAVYIQVGIVGRTGHSDRLGFVHQFEPGSLLLGLCLKTT